MLAILMVVFSTVAATLCGVLLYLYARSRAECRSLNDKLVQAERQYTEDQDALRQRKHLDLLKDEFISTASHELRTPLTSIRGALGLLSAGLIGKMDEEKAQKLLHIASTNTDRLVRLINDILDLERMDSGSSPLQVERCSLPAMVQAAADTMASMAETAGVRIGVPALSTEASEETFDGDPDRIQQVLCNLLSNAIKFSPGGSIIAVTSRADEEYLTLGIEDRGRGVPAEMLEGIFDRFSQVNPDDARQKGGTGLGLAICRSILSQHGGSIWAERNDQHGPGLPGTTFFLRLPRVRPPEYFEPVPVSMEGAILVVDDDAGVRQIVAEQLRRHGYDVLETDRGEQALRIAERQHIEAILLDLYMPGLTGWETLERLKRNPLTANIPVVVLSVLSPASQRSEGTPLLGSTLSTARSAAQGWVQKPFNESLLLAELGRVLHSGTGPGRLLLVEDDQVMADVVLGGFQDIGARQGISVEHVRTVGEAKRACNQQPPDLMILDLTLPDGDGFALVKWLRDQPVLRKLPLVVYSGREVTGSEMEQLRLGPTQFLTKAQVQPEHVEELVLAMVRHLRHPTLEAQTA